MNDNFNNGLIIGSLLGLTVIKKFENAVDINIADVFSLLSFAEAGIEPAAVIRNNWIFQLRQTEIAAAGLSVSPFTTNMITLEVLP